MIIIRFGVVLFVLVSDFCSNQVRRYQAYHGWKVFHIVLSQMFYHGKPNSQSQTTAQSLCYPQIIRITAVKLTAAFIHLLVSFSSPRLCVSSWCL